MIRDIHNFKIFCSTNAILQGTCQPSTHILIKFYQKSYAIMVTIVSAVLFGLFKTDKI